VTFQLHRQIFKVIKALLIKIDPICEIEAQVDFDINL